MRSNSHSPTWAPSSSSWCRALVGFALAIALLQVVQRLRGFLAATDLARDHRRRPIAGCAVAKAEQEHREHGDDRTGHQGQACPFRRPGGGRCLLRAENRPGKHRAQRQPEAQQQADEHAHGRTPPRFRGQQRKLQHGRTGRGRQDHHDGEHARIRQRDRLHGLRAGLDQLHHRTAGAQQQAHQQRADQSDTRPRTQHAPQRGDRQAPAERRQRKHHAVRAGRRFVRWPMRQQGQQRNRPQADGGSQRRQQQRQARGTGRLPVQVIEQAQQQATRAARRDERQQRGRHRARELPDQLDKRVIHRKASPLSGLRKTVRVMDQPRV